MTVRAMLADSVRCRLADDGQGQAGHDRNVIGLHRPSPTMTSYERADTQTQRGPARNAAAYSAPSTSPAGSDSPYSVARSVRPTGVNVLMFPVRCGATPALSSLPAI